MIDLFITGVEQNIDKYYLTAGLTAVMQSLGYSCGVYKPVCLDTFEKDKSLQSYGLSFVKFIDPFIKTYFSYILKKDYSPLISAAKEHLTIEKNVILKDFQSIQEINEILIVEGIAGLTTPLNKSFLEEDIIKILDLPLLLVASAKNPSVNNVILSVNRAKEQGMNLRGIILNDYLKQSTDVNVKLMPRLIEEYTDTEILGTLPPFEKTVNPNDLITEILNNINIESIFKIKIPKLNV